MEHECVQMKPKPWIKWKDEKGRANFGVRRGPIEESSCPHSPEQSSQEQCLRHLDSISLPL